MFHPTGTKTSTACPMRSTVLVGHHNKVVVVASCVRHIFLESGQTNELLVAKQKRLPQSEPYVPVSFEKRHAL